MSGGDVTDVDVIHGDCVDVLADMDADSVDAIVTDPPYGLEFMGREWDRLGDVGQASHAGPTERDDSSSSVFGRVRVAYSASANVKCQRCDRWKWDHEGRKCECGPDAVWPHVKAVEGRRMQEWHQRWTTQALRVLKPGGHLLAFGGTRTYHRLACAIEDAGFDIRDTIAWMYGSGFPKSLNLDGGLGTALKPAHEPIVVARKPLAGTVAANVLEHGTGALNIDACRIDAAGAPVQSAAANRVDFRPGQKCDDGYVKGTGREYGDAGRWPANVALDEAAAAQLDQQKPQGRLYADSGGASRFFYCAKASTADRGPGNTHPTVKPVELMRWLVRLVTPANGLVVDPFAGSGSTGVAAVIEHRRCVLIERDAEYVEIIRRRLAEPIQPVLGFEASP